MEQLGLTYLDKSSDVAYVQVTPVVLEVFDHESAVTVVGCIFAA